jgi:hypothetical protein
MKVGNRIAPGVARRAVMAVWANKLQCSLWSDKPTPHNGWIVVEAKEVRLSRPTSEGGYPGIWVDRGWRGVMVGIEGVDFEGDQP